MAMKPGACYFLKGNAAPSQISRLTILFTGSSSLGLPAVPLMFRFCLPVHLAKIFATIWVSNPLDYDT